MRVRLTELGAKGLLLLAALEVAFLATSYSNLFFLLIVFCAVLGLLGLASALRSLRALSVLALEVPPGPAHAARPVRLTLAVRRRTFDLAFVLETDGEEIPLPAVATVVGLTTLALDLPPQPRGVRTTRAVRAATRFPFGLFEVRRRWPLAAECITHPAPAPATAGAAQRGCGDGSSSAGSGTAVVAGLRPFRAGDAVRDVHWKATARRGTPIAKEREPDAGREPAIVVDRRGTAAELEPMLATATAAVLALGTATRTTWFRSQGLALRLAPGTAAPRELLRWLATATPLPADAPPPDRAPLPQEATRA
ncbi:MAG: DUF58 domain-containing protein [Planctomycetes bacterium]|nr:DUF58 domain-containing protein [Planctomycetota bacterium]